MPKVSFYLRNEDVEAWKAIDKKTQWVSDNLNNKPTIEYRKSFIGAPVLTTKSQIELEKHFKKILNEPANKYSRDNIRFCKHDAVMGLCKKGCKE